MKWTPEEVSRYKPLDNIFLNGLYETRGIPATNPESRAEFLACMIPLTMTDHDMLMRRGRNAAINDLESFAITYFTQLFHLERKELERF